MGIAQLPRQHLEQTQIAARNRPPLARAMMCVLNLLFHATQSTAKLGVQPFGSERYRFISRNTVFPSYGAAARPSTFTTARKSFDPRCASHTSLFASRIAYSVRARKRSAGSGKDRNTRY